MSKRPLHVCAPLLIIVITPCLAVPETAPEPDCFVTPQGNGCCVKLSAIIKMKIQEDPECEIFWNINGTNVATYYQNKTNNSSPITSVTLHSVTVRGCHDVTFKSNCPHADIPGKLLCRLGTYNVTRGITQKAVPDVNEFMSKNNRSDLKLKLPNRDSYMDRSRLDRRHSWFLIGPVSVFILTLLWISWKNKINTRLTINYFSQQTRTPTNISEYTDDIKEEADTDVDVQC